MSSSKNSLMKGIENKILVHNQYGLKLWGNPNKMRDRHGVHTFLCKCDSAHWFQVDQ